MKTRNQLYAREASELLRTVSTYKCVTVEQLQRMLPGRSDKVRTILTQLEKQGRIVCGAEFVAPTDCVEVSDPAMVAAFWVLLDFIERTKYHTSGEFPVKICFFADAEVYEIVYAALGQEALICRALSGPDTPRRLVIVEDIAQIGLLNVPNTVGYCTVSADGAVEYYKNS